MPELCRFYVIVIRMYYQDHSPAHFHAEYGEHEAWLRLRRSLSSGANSRGEPWRWYSNGLPFIARNCGRIGNGRGVGFDWNPSLHWSKEGE